MKFSTKRDENLRRIQQLDPVQDHCQIYQIMTGYEFPWDMTRSLEVALMRKDKEDLSGTVISGYATLNIQTKNS